MAKSKSKQTQRPAYSYVRWSSLEQSSGDSLRRQKDPLKTICTQFGWELQAETYADCGMSAFRSKNKEKGQLAVFLAALKAKTIKPNAVLILEDLDRLSRAKIKAAVDLASEILEAGCDIYSVLEKKLYTVEVLNEPMGMMGLIWRFHLAHEESKKKSERETNRWADNHKQAAKTGEVFSRICPGWLEVVDREKVDGHPVGGRFVPIPERVAVVKQIFQWCIAGDGTQVIMRRLVKDGVPTFGQGKRAGGWSQKTLWQILRDRRVLGDLTTKVYGGEQKAGETIKGYYPAVVAQKVFDAAQDAMMSRKGKTGRRSYYVNLFSGMVRYPGHGCNMVMLAKQSLRKSKAGTKLHEYRYLASYLGWKGEKPYVAVSLDQFETQILSWLHELQPSDVVRNEEDGEGVEALKSRLKFLDERIKEVADGLEKIGVNVPSIMNKLADMQVAKSKLTAEVEERQRESGRPGIKETQSLIELLASKTGEERRELREQVRQRLLLLIDHINVDVEQVGRVQDVQAVVRLRAGGFHEVRYRVEGGKVIDGMHTAWSNEDGITRRDYPDGKTLTVKPAKKKTAAKRGA